MDFRGISDGIPIHQVVELYQALFFLNISHFIISWLQEFPIRHSSCLGNSVTVFRRSALWKLGQIDYAQSWKCSN